MATTQSANEAITRFVADTEIAHQIVHGGDTTQVQTDGGVVDTFAKNMKDMRDDFESGFGGIFDTTVGEYLTAAEVARDDAIAAKNAASGSATAASGSADAADADRVQTGLDRVQTGLDRAAAASSAAEALGYLNVYRTTSYGPSATDPTTDPLGNPPSIGDEYFNTTVNTTKRFNGVFWQASDLNPGTLAAPGGASLIGSDPGTGPFAGMWSTIKGFIDTLISSVGSSVIGYDGQTVQDVLDDAKPMQSYTALRNYTGRATSVRITTPGISGYFQRLAVGDKHYNFEDDGGVIIVDASGRRWKRLFTGAVNVKWFGAKGDGIADDYVPYQAAINFCLATKTTASETLGGGLSSLYSPQGIYKISASLNVSGANGFKIFGDGKQSTQVVFTGSSSNLFSYTGYICCDISDLSLICGVINVAGSLPAVVAPATKNSACIKFNGNGGGTLFTMNRVQMYYWDKVFTTTDSIVNCDNNVYNECSFIGNNYLWDNTNPQAVLWTFNSCKVFSTQIAVFNNAGGDLVVNGGDFINPGTFFKASLTNMGYDAKFTGIRFENYQNIDPSSAPKFLDLASGNTYRNIVFDHCTARGGGSLTGKTSAILAGGFDITLRDCAGFSGNWDVNASTATSGFLSSIIFERCTGEPTINQTLSGGVGNNPINIEYVQRRVANTTMNRRLYGRVNSLSGNAGIFGGIQSDSFGYAATLSASAFGREYAIFCPAPYQLAIAGFDIVWTNNTTSTVVIDIYTDSTKATKIASVTTASASGQRQVISIKPSDLLVRHAISSTSSPLYFEATAAGNAGICSANVNVNLLQV